jgi:ketosteroid isomerase-like protein
MASANLDLVRSVYAALERGDFSSAEWAHPEIEFVMADGPEPGRWTGLAGMAQAWREVLSAWKDARLEVDEYRELDDERVLVLIVFIARGKTSGLDLGRTPLKAANLVHVRGGRVTRLAIYNDRERALADLGLPPKAGDPHP